MKKRLVFMLLLCTFSARLTASPVDIMVGARGMGMGGAYVAIADDQSAAYWNPAGLPQVDQVSVMESNLLYQVHGLNVNYMSLSVPVENVGTVCGSWLLTSVSLEEGWDYTKSAPLTTSNNNEQSYVLSIGRQLWKQLLIFNQTSVGFSINRYTYSTENYKSAGVGLDLGFLTHLPYGCSFGFMGRNLGADIGGEPIDPELRIGAGYTRVFGDMQKITAAIDGLYVMNRDYSFSNGTENGAANNAKGFGGIEYAVTLSGFEVAVRGGFNGLAHTSLNTYGYSLGLGCKYLGHTFEYAFQGRTNSEVSIGGEHHLSLILNLGGAVRKARIALDTVAPVMSLKGDSVLAVSTRDGYYIDSGCMAYDKVSGDLTGKVIIGDAQVNPTVPGTYFVTYSVRDEAGNRGIKRRKIIVKAPDTIAPVIKLRGDSSMTLVTGESYVEPGVNITDNVDTVFPNLKMSGTVDVSKPGENVLTYAVSDRAGNVAIKQRKVVVIYRLFKEFGVPAEKPLGSMKKTFTKIDIEGTGPDLKKIADLTIDWSREDSTLRDINFDLINEKPHGKPVMLNMKDKIQQSFNAKTPKATIINSGIAGLDGEYYIAGNNGNFTWVRTDGSFALTFKP